MSDILSLSANYTFSIKFSRELSGRTRSFGGSFRSDKDSVGKVGFDSFEGVETVKSSRVSSGRLYSMVTPDWMYGVSGTICALFAGALMPLFALGITQALVSYYMDWDTTRHEVKKISLLFCVGAVVTVIVHAIAHMSFGIMGERLTLRVRERMFSGKKLRLSLLLLHLILLTLMLSGSRKDTNSRLQQ